MKQLKFSELSNIIKKELTNIKFQLDLKNEGIIINVFDGIVRMYGLYDAMYGEIIEFVDNIFGLVFNIERTNVGIVILGDYKNLSEGMKGKCTGNLLKVPVGLELIGRVVDTLGIAIDGKGTIKTKKKDLIEKIAPGVICRKTVNQPLNTGIKAIDSMIPIGLGQRELIIGDRNVGKTSLCLDVILNQKNKDITCIYVAIGQKKSNVVKIVNVFEKYGAMNYTIVVVASASDPAIMQYLAPYTGCTMGEYFRDRGKNAVIVYDDLTKQAWAYRQISLLLKRPPGREAYPGDIFYIHSKLLERACRVNKKFVGNQTKGRRNTTGSLTALPIIETKGGDVSEFIPTNVISITDGQIFLETNLFNNGIRPAINVGLSVSRVGGSAQTKIIKKLGSGIRLSLAKYRELESFAQFSSELDKITKKQIIKGRNITELMKQKQLNKRSVAELAILLYAANKDYLNDVDIKKIAFFENELIKYLNIKYKKIRNLINKKGKEEYIEQLKQILEKFKENHR
ncbi:F0F1 ATP synthase subunit alpha [Candidatus Portiera aleyrodidarum]|uniref:ATP synthase subunit alpha n=1 Tax=Candidatus Portiera aleyrodidarum MED (Bemisia tabaci) TaxID=1163752 RepID=A0AAU8RYE1_9GAMM|nr:F0F1 ATP synthase subunit alpha [Candidatus Portiera aleyrodidarum]AFQ24004.1 proton translocating ATP synthase, F1 alpha subunit [Candidatus Portiera aleyrodidarum BT-B-HRs]AFS18770.1 ATP synthase subunit alpha [Candidatus Portiera aleyrodidarum BT-QVLC]AFT80392.1 ATP synthase alpha chain [Candidatus Portiera aleyrodidarum BT-QVLC]AFT80672.1 ATP synthase alpha chain [Candidatus Portiera aleyrodidarum BT-B-HRs]AJF23983.1 ATP F0F1 synthase subunit alpha [Candidatus Portiera aleyrodidarum MED